VGGAEAGGVGAGQVRGSREKQASPSAEVIRLRAAGGVVVRRRGEELRVAVVQSQYGTWVFPKGLIEEGEEPEEAARREVGEETGLRRLELLVPLGWTEHEFEKEGKRFQTRTHWFLYQASPRALVRLDPQEELLDCGWFTSKQAMGLLTHADHRGLLRKVAAWLERGQASNSSS
jgi:diadenosine hexaphosphate hydrolase (ATP-forming)